MFPWVSISDTTIYLQISISILNLALPSDLNTSLLYSQQCCPIELYAMLKMFHTYIVHYDHLRPQVTTEHLKCD